MQAAVEDHDSWNNDLTGHIECLFRCDDVWNIGSSTEKGMVLAETVKSHFWWLFVVACSVGHVSARTHVGNPLCNLASTSFIPWNVTIDVDEC